MLLQRLREQAVRWKTQREMADAIGVHESTLSKWLTEDPEKHVDPNPVLDDLDALSDALGIPVHQLVSQAHPPPQRPEPRVDATKLAKVLARFERRLGEVMQDAREAAGLLDQKRQR